MTTIVTQICDGCKATSSDGKMQMWYVNVVLCGAAYTSHGSVAASLHLCRACVEDKYLVPKTLTRPPEAKQQPEHKPTAEELIRQLMEMVQ